MRLRGTIVLLGLGLVGLDLAACSSKDKTPVDQTPDTCSIKPVLDVFANRCATSGACHVTGGQYPDFTAAGLAGWKGKNSKAMPNEPLAVPGNPDGSWVYRKVSGQHGSSGALMPLGAAMPIAEADVIRDWIANGAATVCSGEEVPTTPVRFDPNTLDQTELFTCKDPAAARSSIARIRRIDQVEWTHGIGAPNAPTFTNLTAYLNPFSSKSGAYSTYAADNTVDSATLDLYFLNLPEAGISWDATYASMRSHAVINDKTLSCFFNDALPQPDCIDKFVTKLLQIGVLSRTPTADEIARLKAYTVAALAREPGGGQAGAPREATIHEISAAAWMTAGALFRSEIGEPVAGDAAGRRKLTNEELALAIGSVLSTHRPGSLMWAGFQYTPPAPDDADPKLGWLQQIRAAADNGTIQDPTVIRSLIATYASNIDFDRRDILFDKFNDTRDVPARGEYVLAPRIIGFFREWLDYQGALSSFKDTPGGTSKYKTTSDLYDRTAGGYENLQTRYYMYETTLVDQLDDTIARTVVESAGSGNDVFAALFTSLQWRLPSDHVNLNSQTCMVDADCTMDPKYKSCNQVFKVCGDSVSGSTSRHARVYNVEGVPDTQAGRWVTMNAAERSGVLTHPAWLGAHGANFEDDASLVHRGKWIREKLFCQTVPGLENVMVQAKLGAHGPSARERVDEATTTGPNAQTCQGCHSLMNPLGYPFEIYDHAGFLRETDHGHAPDGTTTITNSPDPELNRSFQDAIEFSQAIADSPYAKRCFIRQAFRYFTGRDETLEDACTLAAMETALNSGSFVDMLTVLVESDTFQYRTIQGGTP